MSLPWIIGAVVVLVGLWFVRVFNGFVSLKNRVQNAWSDITVQLKRRYDVIPNLVEVVKGYATHESSLFENVAAVRANAMNQTGVAEKAEAENELSNTLKTLFAVSENYPELKASENFQMLQKQLSTLEDDIASARKYYNATARELNTTSQTFPNNLVANMCGVKHAAFFETTAQEKEVVNVTM